MSVDLPAQGREVLTFYLIQYLLTNLNILVDHNDDSINANSNLLGRRFAAALLPRLFGINPRSHHKGATGRVRTGNQRLLVLCHCQLGQDIPILVFHLIFANIAKMI